MFATVAIVQISVSEGATYWQYTNVIIVIIIILVFYTFGV